MGLISADLNGKKVLESHSTIPAWGASYHDVTCDTEFTLTGACTLTIADLVVKCTVLSGGPAHGRSFYRLVAGAGGWANPIPAKSYANDAGVKLSTVLGDAASAVGETIDATTVNQLTRLGPAWTRPYDPASRVLELVAPNAWYVSENGLTRLGSRPPSTLTAKTATTSQIDLARGTCTIASDTIAGILPGLVCNGLTAVDVEHEISAKGGLRSKIWGAQGSGMSRRLAAYRAIQDQLDPNRLFRGTYEYRIGTQDGNRLNIQPVRVSTGVPSLNRVVVRPGVPGVKAQYALGARVLVTWVNADPSRPVVVGFEDADGPGFLPISLALMSGTLAVARATDPVSVSVTSAEIVALGLVAPSGGGPITAPLPTSSTATGTITSGSPTVTSG